ncbi:hypothetical protein AB0E63_05420 [Kribbella sp. NPDC026596]|uniref:hypothetical protein n=1 Tax=Kribbella sp. NPDC026596 TaxID=3155122 RepID=UPI0033DF0C13
MHEVGRPQRSGGVGVAPRRADSVVIFGVTGDLVSKKIFPALYELARRDRLDGPVVGVGRTAWSTDELIAAARGSVLRAKGPRVAEPSWRSRSGATLLPPGASTPL